MRFRLLAATVAVLTVAGCGGGGPSISANDKSACDTLNSASSPAPDPQALYNAFGLNGSAHGMSQKLSPYAQLVGSDAQLLLSGDDDGKLGEYVGQMRGVCETLGWRASDS